MDGFFNLKTGEEGGAVGTKQEREVDLSLRLIETYASRQMEWALQALEDNEFRNGIQWTAAEKSELASRRQAANVWNLIHPAVEMLKALLTDNSPRFQATSKEHSDRDYAALVSDLMSHIWNISDGDVIFKQLIDDYGVMGRGVFMVYVDSAADFNRGEVKLKCLYPLHVYPDPDSKDPFCRDAAHILLSCLYSAEQVQAEYPRYWNQVEKDGTTSVHQRNPIQVNTDEEQNRQTAPLQLEKQDTDYYEVLDRYSKVLIKRFHVLNTETGKEDIFSEEELGEFNSRPAIKIVGASGQTEYVYATEQVEELGRMMLESGQNIFHQVEVVTTDEMGNEVSLDPQIMPGEPQESGENAVPDSRMEFVSVTYGEVMEFLPFEMQELELIRIKRVLVIGEVEVFSEILEIDSFPIIVLNNHHNRNPYPQGDVRFARDPQLYFNKMKSLILAHTANSTGTKVLVPRGTDVDEMEKKWGRAGAAFIEVDMEIGQPVVAQVPPLSNALFAELRDAELKVQKEFGIYDLQGGDASAAPNTYKGTLAVEEYGQRRMRSKRESLEGFLNSVAAVVAQLIPQVYTERKVIRLFQPNMRPKEFEINIPVTHEYTGEVIERINDIAALRYDIIVVSGSTLPSNRWARFEAMLQLYQLGLIDDVAMMQFVDIPGVEDILQRKSQMMSLVNENNALKEELKKISGDLQTAQREAVHANQRVEVEQFASRLAKIEAGAKADTKVMTERAADAISDTKEMTKITLDAIAKRREMEAKTSSVAK